jgi:signal transduction histidine kinase
LHTAVECDGTGIGLAVVKRVVKEMGGNIGVDSVPGKGSTFVVSMPVSLLETAPHKMRR